MDEENVLVKRYGLKNKREIWKDKDCCFKNSEEELKILLEKILQNNKLSLIKINKININVNSISDVLALTEENLFERRLQTVLFKKKLANTVKAARQLIVHKNVLVNGQIVNIPSFIVNKDMENKISIKEKPVKEKVEIKEESVESPTEDAPVEPEIKEEEKAE